MFENSFEKSPFVMPQAGFYFATLFKYKNTSKIYLLLGGNIGEVLSNFNLARHLVEKHIGKTIKISHVYKTAAWGKEDQPDFLNQMICVETCFTPTMILDKILTIERTMGRIRIGKWAQRTIDIDIIAMDAIQYRSRGLQIPHALMQERNFVLIPFFELNKDWIHPVFNKSIKRLLKESKDKLTVVKLKC